MPVSLSVLVQDQNFFAACHMAAVYILNLLATELYSFWQTSFGTLYLMVVSSGVMLPRSILSCALSQA